MKTKRIMAVPTACFFGVVAVCLIGIIVGSFCDLSINKALANKTSIYAWADTEMKRNAIKQVGKNHVSPVDPIWVDDEDMIRKLYGLD